MKKNLLRGREFQRLPLKRPTLETQTKKDLLFVVGEFVDVAGQWVRLGVHHQVEEVDEAEEARPAQVGGRVVTCTGQAYQCVSMIPENVFSEIFLGRWDGP